MSESSTPEVSSKYGTDLVADRNLLANLIARARTAAAEIVRALERLETETLQDGPVPPVSCRLLEMAAIYRHLDRVRINSEMVGVEEP